MGNPVPFPDQEFKLVFSLLAPPFFSPLELARDPGILFPPPLFSLSSFFTCLALCAPSPPCLRPGKKYGLGQRGGNSLKRELAM